MIAIKDSSNCIVLGDDMEFVIYSENYPVDNEGNRIPERKAHEGNRRLGDIIIQTPSVKYRFKKIHLSNEFTDIINSCVANYIEEGKKDFVIYLDSLVIEDDNMDFWEFLYEDLSIEKA